MATPTTGLGVSITGLPYGQAYDAKGNLQMINSAPTGTLSYQNPTATNTSTPNVTSTPTTSGTASAPVNNYSVVTSKPATTAVNNAQSFYTNTIQPAVTTATQTNAQNNAQASQVPVTTGFNPYTTTKTGNPGEVSTTMNGQTYYSTPVAQPATANDIINGLNNPASTGTTAPSGGTPAPGTPAANIQSGLAGEQKENTSYQANVSHENDVIAQHAEDYANAIQISAASIPFTPAQQSLIDATNSAFQQMTTNANLKAAALSSETGGVSNMINAMGGQLIGIAADQAAAIAKMEVGFQTENFNEKYKTVTDAYAAFKDAENAKMDALTKIHDSVMTTYQNAVAAAQAQQTYQQSKTQFEQTNANAQQTLAQNKYEYRDLKDDMGTTIGTQVFDKATGTVVGSHYSSGQTDPSTGLTSPTTKVNQDGSVDKTSQYATLQAVVPKHYQALVWSIVNNKGDAPNTRTVAGQKLAAWVTQVDPTLSDGSGGFDAVKYAGRLNMQKDLAKNSQGSLGGAVNSANKMIAHLAAFDSSVTSRGNGSMSSTLNSISNAISKPLAGMLNPTGAGTLNLQGISQKADTEKIGLTDEMAKFFKGTGSTDVQSIADWGKTLDPNITPGGQKGMIQGTLDLFSGQLQTFIAQYTNVMGHTPDLGTILQPQAVKTLSQFKNAGYKVDLPGVYYTDKSAWQANGGSQEQWNGAVDALTKAGLPVTDENILQAAQALNE